MIDIDKIEAAAKGATPGAWELTRWGRFPADVKAVGHDGTYRTICIKSELATHPYADLTHIATANPSAVLEMISMIRERDAVLRQALEALERQKACIEENVTGQRTNVPAIAAIKGVLTRTAQTPPPRLDGIAMANIWNKYSEADGWYARCRALETAVRKQFGVNDD